MNSKMTYFFLFFLVILIILVIAGMNCNSLIKIERQKPTVVGYRELIEKTDGYSIYRDCEYKLVSVTYDTIINRQLSTGETSVIRTHPIPDRVDLNDIFDPQREGDTDWNYTDIDEEEMWYLDSVGIYWDGRYGCYRRHK